MCMQNDRRKSRAIFQLNAEVLQSAELSTARSNVETLEDICIKLTWASTFLMLYIPEGTRIHIHVFEAYSQWTCLLVSQNGWVLAPIVCITTVVMPSYGWIWRFPMSKWSNIGYKWWTPPTKVESIDEIAIKYPQKVHKHRKKSKSLEGTHLALPESGDEKLLGEGSHLPKPQGFSRCGWPAIVCKCADLWKLNMQPWKGHVHNHVNAFRGRRTWDQDTHPKVD